jgi:hypothetical protein
VLRNDGEGTPVSVMTRNLEFRILKSDGQVPSSKFQVPLDAGPPEKFNPEIEQSQKMFEGKYFLVFATQDKGSGVDHYEVCEGKRQCVIAESPYPPENQQLDKKIFVKAIDKNGNERIEIFYPPNFHPWYKNYWILGTLIIVTAIIVGVILQKGLWRKILH